EASVFPQTNRTELLASLAEFGLPLLPGHDQVPAREQTVGHDIVAQHALDPFPPGDGFDRVNRELSLAQVLGLVDDGVAVTYRRHREERLESPVDPTPDAAVGLEDAVPCLGDDHVH